ncbi:hypothetical protein [Nocardia sp. CNY236]|uniref:Rv0361 family membrane protein n=1 Tax=Nocardia sp. CNY236 TaxID=1169152 RepID=UPI000419867F|nr:hypothetical protein [Nocardia sp. CNY236]
MGAPKKGRTAVLVAVVAVVISVGGVAGVALNVARNDSATPQQDPVAAAADPVASAEEQIESAIREFYGIVGNEAFSTAMTQACARDRDWFAQLSAEKQNEFDAMALPVTIDRIDDIEVTGTSASAVVTVQLAPGQGSETDSATEYLIQENGQWRLCSPEGSLR